MAICRRQVMPRRSLNSAFRRSVSDYLADCGILMESGEAAESAAERLAAMGVN
jgi:hypothetical protein